MAKKLYIEDGEAIPSIIIQDAVETAPTGFTEGSTIANFLAYGTDYGMSRHEVIIECLALVTDWATHDAGEKAAMITEIENNVETFEIPQEVIDDLTPPYKGFKVFNTTTSKPNWWNGTEWYATQSSEDFIYRQGIDGAFLPGYGGTAGTYSYVGGLTTSVHLGSGGNNQSAKRIYHFKLPSNFKEFKDITVGTYRFGVVDSFTCSLIKAPALPHASGATGIVDSAINASSVLPTANDTHESMSFVPGSSYSAGDIVSVQFDDIVDNGVYAEISFVKLNFYTN